MNLVRHFLEQIKEINVFHWKSCRDSNRQIKTKSQTSFIKSMLDKEL